MGGEAVWRRKTRSVATVVSRRRLGAVMCVDGAATSATVRSFIGHLLSTASLGPRLDFLNGAYFFSFTAFILEVLFSFSLYPLVGLRSLSQSNAR